MTKPCRYRRRSVTFLILMLVVAWDFGGSYAFQPSLLRRTGGRSGRRQSNTRRHCRLKGAAVDLEDDNDGSSSNVLTATQISARTARTSKAKKEKAPKREGKITNKRSKNTSPTKNSTKRPRSPRANDSLQKSRQLNQKITKCSSAAELLQLLQESAPLHKPYADYVFNTVNFSTSLHRLARHSIGEATTRAEVLADPRFALLLASIAEGLYDPSGRLSFQSREISNVAWALSKLKLPPPATAMPLPDSPRDQVIGSAKAVREAIMAAATKRRDGVASREWIPAVSQLAGYVLDAIGERVEEMSSNIKSTFKMQELSNMSWAWATAGRMNSRVAKVILNTMVQQQKEILNTEGESGLRPQEWSNTIWAIATSQTYDGYEDFLEYLATLLTDFPGFIQQFKPQEWSNTVWGVATLLSNRDDAALTEREQRAALTIVRCAASYVIQRGAASFKSQELSNTMWGMSTLGFGLDASSEQNLNNNYFVLKTDDVEGDRALAQHTLEAILQAAFPLLPRFRSQELNNLAWSLARQIAVEEKTPQIEKVLDGIGRQLYHPKRKVSSQDIGTTLWSLATLEHKDDDLFRSVVARMRPDMAHTYKAQELSNTVWACAKVGVEPGDIDAFDTTLVAGTKNAPRIRDPVTRCFAIAAQQLMQRPHHFKPQEIKDVLWSFSKIGIRHPPLFRSVAVHLVGEEAGDERARGLDEFSPQGLGNLAWSYARQGQLGAGVSDRLKKGKGNGRLQVYTTILSDIGEARLHRLFSAVADTYLEVHQQLKKGSPQDLSNTAWAFASIGLKHNAFLEALRNEVVFRIQRYVRGERTAKTFFKGQEISNVLWTMATLNCPEVELVRCLGPYIRTVCAKRNEDVSVPMIANFLSRQELANMAWSSAVIGEYPSDLMGFLYDGLVGSGTDQDPAVMAEYHGDLGLQHQAVMTLLYVQTALDLAGSRISVSLPENFPEGWKDTKTSLENDHMTDIFDEVELNLVVSNIQRSVTNAFTRIGFNHIQEHVITMKDLATESAISIPPKPIELLSIDVADPKSKIAIEVDGPAHFVTRIGTGVNSPEGYARVINGKYEYQYLWDGKAQEVNGPTALKQRLLRSLGWKTISIPFWEWFAVAGDKEKEEEYCRKLLAGIE